MDKLANQAQKAPSWTRKRYTKPQLIQYGHVEKLTQTGGATHHDGTSGNSHKVGQ